MQSSKNRNQDSERTLAAAQPLNNPSETPTGPFLSLAEAVSYIRCHKRTIRRRIDDGLLPSYKHGRMRVVKRQDLDTMLVGGATDSLPQDRNDA